MEIGFTLSSEEQGPKELVHLARGAEEAGFSFATISDHFHPWTSHQGNSPFVWSVLGAIAEATSQIRVGTAVTWRLIRIHPAIVAQAAATVADDAGSLLPWCRYRREPQRARDWSTLALRQRTTRTPEGGDRGRTKPLAGGLSSTGGLATR